MGSYEDPALTATLVRERQASAVSELAAAAAREIRSRGWFKGQYGSDRNNIDTCAVCVLGAIRAASHGNPFTYPYLHRDADALVARIRRRIKGGRYLPEWNDAPGTTEADVLAVFDAIANGDPA